MTFLYYDPVFLEHETGMHPERAERLRRIVRYLDESGLQKRCTQQEFGPVTLERLARVHRAKYVDEIRDFASDRGGPVDADTVISPRSYDAACMAAGAVCDAVQRVLKGEGTRALCLVRPPGHHARTAQAMGFCLFNNIAVGARVATAEWELDRVLIVDWDVHHGNGTQETFYEDEQVAFFSIHRWPFYPGTGNVHERGAGKGLGTIRNVPIAYGTSRADYHQEFNHQLQSLADSMRPQLVLISAGFDSHRQDPIGSLGLEVEDFAALTKTVTQIAAAHSEGRIVSVLEGGYNVDVLPRCVAAHLEALDESE